MTSRPDLRQHRCADAQGRGWGARGGEGESPRGCSTRPSFSARADPVPVAICQHESGSRPPGSTECPLTAINASRFCWLDDLPTRSEPDQGHNRAPVQIRAIGVSDSERARVLRPLDTRENGLMSQVVEAGLIAGSAAVAASLITSFLALAITRTQVRAAERMARVAFMSERQADLYVELGELAERMRASADVASEIALGRPSSHPAPPPLSDERWFAFQGRLRVFGSRMARDAFGSLQAATESLQASATAAQAGHPPDAQEVAGCLEAAAEAISRIRTIASAEVGPLHDILLTSECHWWQFRCPRVDRRVLATFAAGTD